MPIKPENAGRYPADWKAIRAEILARADNRCEQCGAVNHQLGWRDVSGTFHPVTLEACERVDGQLVIDAGHYEGLAKVIRIVLTVAHIDHMPENVGEPGHRPNLAAWCQRCHLRHDQAHHQRNAAQTRRANKLTGDLFA